jgi:hypothetical protein
MDRHVVALFIPILALAIPVAAIVFHGLQRLARTRLEESRLRLGALDGQAEADIEALRQDVGELRREFGEMQERLDFAERLLSQARDPERLPGRPPA